MRTRTLVVLGAIVLVVALALVLILSNPAPQADSRVHITLLQLNDVYEITPVSGGAQGGMARVATLRKQLLAENPNTFMILAGDLFSPSALGTATVDGDRLAGKQMVDVMNAAGLDLATFGNHEFDLNQERFLSRLSESHFKWISANAFDANGQPFPNITANHVITVTGTDGREVRIGFFGLTLNSNQPDYVIYRDPLEVANEQVQALRNKVDILIAVTHLSIAQDEQLVEKYPEIDLVLGGHEHENIQVWRGPGFTPIFKADANARTVYVHDLYYNTDTRGLEIRSQLRFVNASIPDDPEVAQIINGWLDRAFEGFRASGFEPRAVVAEVPLALDGLESSVRNRPTALTDLIAKGMLNAAPGTQLAIYNGGSIRIDDILPPGDITEYDVIRILPFGGNVLSAQMKGSLIGRVLDQGVLNRGSGGYLQTANVARNVDDSGWLIEGQPFGDDQTYQVVINDFLLMGNETGLDYLTSDNPDVSNVGEHGDIRRALIDELKREYGSK